MSQNRPPFPPMNGPYAPPGGQGAQYPQGQQYGQPAYPVQPPYPMVPQAPSMAPQSHPMMVQLQNMEHVIAQQNEALAQQQQAFNDLYARLAQQEQLVNENRSALLAMPTMAQLGGSGPEPWVRTPFFPTAPFLSTNPDVANQVRYYGVSLQAGGTQTYQIGSETNVTLTFDIPVRVVAINGAAYNMQAVGSSVGALTEQNMNLTYLFRMEYTNGDKLHINPRLASTVVGTQQNPGEIGFNGYTVDQGGTVQFGITPLMDNLAIYITLVCLEVRGPRNTSAPGRRN